MTMFRSIEGMSSDAHAQVKPPAPQSRYHPRAPHSRRDPGDRHGPVAAANRGRPRGGGAGGVQPAGRHPRRAAPGRGAAGRRADRRRSGRRPRRQGRRATPRAAQAFDLPEGLPGADAPPIDVAKGDYPELRPATARVPAVGEPLSLAQLQAVASANSPVLKRAAADVEAAYGAVVQAGLYPNPTMGYQADQIQPRLNVPFPGARQRGGAARRRSSANSSRPPANCRSPSKSPGYDYINALVAVRRAEVDVATAVRVNYFRVLVAQAIGRGQRARWRNSPTRSTGSRPSKSKPGEAAGYEPLQLYAQAQQARNALSQAEADYQVGLATTRRRARPTGPATRVRSPAAPTPPRRDLDQDALRARVEAQHTDLYSPPATASRKPRLI